MTLVKKHLRATYGLDSAGEKVINVGYPTDLQDGVNVQYFIDQNTVQEYDSSRSYKENFVVQYLRKLYSATRNIEAPAGAFDIQNWNEIRTDIKWVNFDSSTTYTKEAYPGEQILVDLRYSSRTIRLPQEPQHGDSVLVKDTFKALPYNTLEIHTSKFSFSTGGSVFKPQVPGEFNIFIWDDFSKKWQVFRHFLDISQQNIKSSVKLQNNQPVQIGVGQTVLVNSLEKNHEIKFPVFANDNEIITIIDEFQNLGNNPLKIHCYNTQEENNRYTINNKSDYFLLDKPGITKFIYKSEQKNWVPMYEVIRSWQKITSNYKAKSFDNLHLQPNSDIRIELPENASIGDEIQFANVYGYLYQVSVVPQNPDHKIIGNINEQYNKKYQQLTKGTPEESDSFVLPGNGQGTQLSLTYLENNKWFVSNFNTRVEHVDELNRSRPGIAQLADQSEVNKNHENNPSDDQIVTPKTLANKTSTEDRRGISRIATVAEVNLPTDSNHLHDVIVTPRALNNRQATETIRGLAEITSNTEVLDNNNDTHIITPKKLNHRRAQETLSGVALLVSTWSPVPATSRTNEGTGVYQNKSNNIDIITPKSLSQAQATENSKGVAWISTQSEANENKEQASDSVIITPKKLANRTALESRTGVARMVNRASEEHKQNINDSLHQEVFITPKALAEREATETLSGIDFIATQSDLDTGALNRKIITPLKFKNWMSYDHFLCDNATGIEHTGNLWSKVNLSIRSATESQKGTLRTATQSEANDQQNNVSDDLYITPKKLNGRRATQSLYGIAKIAQSSEVDQGTLNNETFITPAGLVRWTLTSPNAQFTEEKRGVGRSSTIIETWEGNEFSGSTNNYQSYQDQYVVTPRKLNYALLNYLPVKGKAYDSDKFDSLDSTQFLRSDVDTVNTAQVTIKKNASIGQIKLIPISTQGTELSKTDLQDKSGGLIYQDTTNLVIDNNLSNADQIIFEINGDKKAELKNTGEFSSNSGTFNSLQSNSLSVSNQITYKGHSAEDYFVKSSGHIMTGDLEIKKSDGNSKLLLNGKTGTSGVPEISLQNTQGNGQIKIDPTGNFVFNKSDAEKIVIYDDRVAIKDRLLVKDKEIVDNNGKIDYSLLKNTPDAQINQKGIVQISENLDENSTNLVPNMKVFNDLKQIVDQKADTVGSSYKNIKIKEFLQIGNIRLVPDYENKQINFVWVDTDEEVNS